MEKLNYTLGLDLGVTSVGYCVMLNDEHDDPIKIIDMNSRIFEAAEVHETGGSLAVPRREARGARRRNRRKVRRILRTKELLVSHNIIDKDILKDLYNDNKNLNTDIYELRVNALSMKLSDIDLSRILINFVKKRGYKSNSKAENNNKETGKALGAIKINNELVDKAEKESKELKEFESFHKIRRTLDKIKKDYKGSIT